MTNGKRPSFRGIYFIGLAATTIGIGVIIFLNLATPLEYIRGQLTAPDQIKALHLRQLVHIFNLAFLLLLSCPPLLFIIRHFLRPLSDYFNLLRVGQESEDLLENARRRLINLPYIIIPVNLGLLSQGIRLRDFGLLSGPFLCLFCHLECAQQIDQKLHRRADRKYSFCRDQNQGGGLTDKGESRLK